MSKLNVFFTAGCIPGLDILELLKTLQTAGANRVEIGMPYSDPIVDGPIIQEANKVALANGMSIENLLKALKNLKNEVSIPVSLMGYLNPVMQYGVEKFVKEAKSCGVEGLIIPDLPAEYFEKEYADLFRENDLKFTFIITPQTTPERIDYFQSLSDGFLYAVSDNSITGKKLNQNKREEYFKALKKLKLKNELYIGFGIRDKSDFDYVTQFANGAIIGTAFLEALQKDDKNYLTTAEKFIKGIKGF